MTTKQTRTSVFRSTAPRLALVLLALAATRPMHVAASDPQPIVEFD